MVIAKVLQVRAIPAWWGFTAASDRQKLDAFVSIVQHYIKYIN